jgi:hypothetical protein
LWQQMITIDWTEENYDTCSYCDTTKEWWWWWWWWKLQNYCKQQFPLLFLLWQQMKYKQQSNETGPQKKKLARPALIAILPTREWWWRKTLLQQHSLSPPPRCHFGALPLLPTQEAAKPRQQNHQKKQLEKHTLQQATANGAGQVPRPPPRPKKKKNVYWPCEHWPHRFRRFWK